MEEQQSIKPQGTTIELIVIENQGSFLHKFCFIHYKHFKHDFEDGIQSIRG
jgi:hypothetical protein